MRLFFVTALLTFSAVGEDLPERTKPLAVESDTDIHSYLTNSDVFACASIAARLLDMPTKLAGAAEIPCVMQVECAPKKGKREAAQKFSFKDEAGYVLACPGDKGKKTCPSVSACADYSSRNNWTEKLKDLEKVKVIVTDRIAVLARSDVQGAYFTPLGRAFKFLGRDDVEWSGFCANFVDSPDAKADDRIRLAVCPYTKNPKDEDACPAPSACFKAMSDEVKKLILPASAINTRKD